ncbi:sensor histidine kinase [Flavihumibacter sp. UBA7668]|uniref:sensor histidine kinase n=1 Tax=Flavihumibacter sp. UBA7668 TaxID=1946542 RepID=UPI0025C7290F|nr:ATP-binding protein [Flavihumibacter sp. UBA7668]
MNASQFEIIYTMAAAVIIMLALSGFVVYLILSSQKRRIRLQHEQQHMKESYEKEVLTTQIESRDQTLRDISQEIHDNMGQLLSVARINLNILEKELEEHTSFKRIKDTNQILADVIKYIRMLSKGLNSDMLSSYGLRESIKFELDRIAQTAMISTRFETEGDDFLIDEKKEIILYRMIQEILNNILKHANATEILIRMNYTATYFMLNISDNGKGFSKEEAGSKSIKEAGSGLKNLEKRAQLVGASIQIETSPGQGTSIHILLPKQINHATN